MNEPNSIVNPEIDVRNNGCNLHDFIDFRNIFLGKSPKNIASDLLLKFRSSFHFSSFVFSTEVSLQPFISSRSWIFPVNVEC